jgi:NADPH-dependent FMN reductase
VSTIVEVGNPEPRCRTRSAAELVVERLTGALPDRAVDVIDLGAGLLGWGDPDVADAVTALREAEVAVVASPTCTATYTGLLELLLDQVGTGDLTGVVAVPLMLGGGPPTRWRRSCRSSRCWSSRAPPPRPAACTCSTRRGTSRARWTTGSSPPGPRSPPSARQDGADRPP